MSNQDNNIIWFIVATTSLILLLAGFIATILYLYQKKQFLYLKSLEEMKLDHEKNILQSQLEIQEQTFQDVSRDIHDNISLSLTLAKLQLNTANITEPSNIEEKISIAIRLISESIENLSNISKSLNADLIKNHGLLKAIENEVSILNKTGLYNIEYSILGCPVFMESKVEIILFRIIQESFNNVIKHAQAKKIRLILAYEENRIDLTVEDNGIGFLKSKLQENLTMTKKAGLNNMQQRAKMINGSCEIESKINFGTTVKISIPL